MQRRLGHGQRGDSCHTGRPHCHCGSRASAGCTCVWRDDSAPLRTPRTQEGGGRSFAIRARPCPWVIGSEAKESSLSSVICHLTSFTRCDSMPLQMRSGQSFLHGDARSNPFPDAHPSRARSPAEYASNGAREQAFPDARLRAHCHGPGTHPRGTSALAALPARDPQMPACVRVWAHPSALAHTKRGTRSI